MKKYFFLIISVLVLVMATSCDRNWQGSWYKYEGDELECRLAGNATTGYQWTCTVSDESLIYLDDIDYNTKSDKNLVGAGGYWEFEFQTRRLSGSAEIYFDYLRTWEGTPIESRILSVTVKNGRIVSVTEL